MAESNKNFICDCCRREMSLENAVELNTYPEDTRAKRKPMICSDCARELFLMIMKEFPYEEDEE